MADATVSQRFPVVDGHGHLVDLAFAGRRRLHAPQPGPCDAPRMRQAGVVAQISACWVPAAEEMADRPAAGALAWRTLLDMAGFVASELASEAGEHVALALHAGDLEAALNAGKVALILGMEGADALQDDPGRLTDLYRAGFRHICPAHVGSNAFLTSSLVWSPAGFRHYDPQRDGSAGLSPLGKALVREINRLDMLLDLTHMTEPCFWDAIATTRAPVIVGHAGARAVTPCVRYLSDDQIKAVAKAGGVVCASPLPLCGEHTSLDTLLDQIEHMTRVAGHDHVGFGTDFLDQNDRPAGFGDIGEVTNLIRGLEHRNCRPAHIEGILGGNLLRVLRAVLPAG